MPARGPRSGNAGDHVSLPNRSALCEAPIPRPDRPRGDVLPSEESASLIMWAWPRLLGWPRKVNWLFSPVVGNKRHPGDLWGLDSDGDLLIVETKLDRGHAQDPFVDLLHYSRSKERWRCQSEALQEHWGPLIRAEERFLQTEWPGLTPKKPLTGLHRGVVPYSVHRDATWRWQDLYRSRIASRLDGTHYRRAVERGLHTREEKGNPPPVYVGLIAAVKPRSPRLSPAGEAALRALRDRPESDRVFLRLFRAAPAGRFVKVECSTPRGASGG